MEDQSQLEKWEGEVSVGLPSINADQAWSLLSDFFAIHQWLPGIHTCEKLSGSGSELGSIRYVTSPPGVNSEPVLWAKEELVRFDRIERSFSYRVIESNMGFGDYVAHFRVLEKDGNSGSGCGLKWSFECEPIKGWSQEGLVGYLDLGLKAMAERVEATVRASGSDDTLDC